MTVGSLFSGIGGLDLGLERAGMSVVWQSEVDPYACRVLAKHWPHVPNLGDVTTIDWSTVERPDLICGGYPCQPFSSIGHRSGGDDPRHLWPHMLGALRALRPRYALLENVAGHLRLGFDRVLADLAELGLNAEWSTVSACTVGAPHRRRRLFCVAYAAGIGRETGVGLLGAIPASGLLWGDAGGDAGRRWSAPDAGVHRVADGFPTVVDIDRLRTLGNAVVPQVAEWIGRRIMDAAT
jgi:DNA (cytosine-5)-methyltransferase 1